MAKMSDHQRGHADPDYKPTALPEAKDMNLWTQAKRAARKHFKGKKPTKDMLDGWAVDWYADQGGLFKENGDGGMTAETGNKAKDKNKDSKKAVEDAKASILLLPIFAKKLTTEERSKLKPEEFADPEEMKYPIDTKERGIDALSRVSANGTPTEISKVRKAVYKRYPFLKKGNKTKASYGNGLRNLQILSNVLRGISDNTEIQVTPRGAVINIVANKHLIKLDRDALFQPQVTFNKVIYKLSKAITAKVPPGDTAATQEATLAKYEAQVQTINDKITALKAKMEKTQDEAE